MSDLEDIRSRARRLEDARFAEYWATIVESASILNELQPVKRRPWLAEVVDEMYREQDRRCALCGEPMELTEVEVDHAIPFSYGGGNERTNIQLAHRECNRSKRNSVDAGDLLRYLESRYMNL